MTKYNEFYSKNDCDLLIDNDFKKLILNKSVIIDDLGNKYIVFSPQESNLPYLNYNHKIEVKSTCQADLFVPRLFVSFDSNYKSLDILNKEKPFIPINTIIDKLDITKKSYKLVIKTVLVYDDADLFGSELTSYNQINSFNVNELDSNIKYESTLELIELLPSNELYDSPSVISNFEIVFDNNIHIYIRSYRKFYQIFPYYALMFHFLIQVVRGIFIIIDSNNLYLQFINSFYEVTVSDKRNSCDSNSKSIFKERTNQQFNQNDIRNQESSLIKMSFLNSPLASVEQTRFVEEEMVVEKPVKKIKSQKKKNSIQSARKYLFGLSDLISFLFSLSCCKKTTTKEKLYNSLKTQLVFYLNPLYYFKLCSLNEADVMESITERHIYSAVINSDFDNFTISRNNSLDDKRKSGDQFRKSNYYNEFDNNEKLQRIYASLDNTFTI